MKFILCFLLSFLIGCAVGPDYKKPEIEVITDKFIESKIQWVEAKPNADIDRGEWWKIYKDSSLNELEDKLNNNNQNIISADHSYKAAMALVKQAKASYLPSASATYDVTKQREKTNNSSSSSKITKDHSLGLSASWELDLWGSIGYTVKANRASAEYSKADWASIKLSMQSSLAQYYFELRAADVEQKMLDDIVKANKAILTYNENRYKSGMIDKSDLYNAQNNYHNSQTDSLNNQAYRSQYQHAIAVLIGESPSIFSLKNNNKNDDMDILVPVTMPSVLLERRPDIAKSEKLVAQSNAQIGTAKTAFFPSLTLGASSNLSGSGLGDLLSLPNLTWSVGPQLALGLFDGGSRFAQMENAKETYNANVAAYKQTVLSAFSEVEDQLSSLKSLQDQVKLQKKVSDNNMDLLKQTNHQYNAGIIDYASVLNAKITHLNSAKTLSETIKSKRLAEINLIKALGGGWKH